LFDKDKKKEKLPLEKQSEPKIKVQCNCTKRMLEQSPSSGNCPYCGGVIG